MKEPLKIPLDVDISRRCFLRLVSGRRLRLDTARFRCARPLSAPRAPAFGGDCGGIFRVVARTSPRAAALSGRKNALLHSAELAVNSYSKNAIFLLDIERELGVFLAYSRVGSRREHGSGFGSDYDSSLDSGCGARAIALSR